MKHTVVGNCPICGSPIYGAAEVEEGEVPPHPRRTCFCIPGQPGGFALERSSGGTIETGMGDVIVRYDSPLSVTVTAGATHSVETTLEEAD